jgi:hypothetical protein
MATTSFFSIFLGQCDDESPMSAEAVVVPEPPVSKKTVLGDLISQDIVTEHFS